MEFYPDIGKPRLYPFYGMSSIAVVLVVDMIAIMVLVRYTTKQGKVEN